MTILTLTQINQFRRDGFLVLPGLADTIYCDAAIAFAQNELRNNAAPIEYEADTRYPGAPASSDAEGGWTARRLLQAMARSPLLEKWAKSERLTPVLRQLLGEEVYLSQVHHNCIMTKQPRFSSVTGWHRDSRYWHFQRTDLVTAWLALSNETPENGCLSVIPGSHWRILAPAQFDERHFLRVDMPNKPCAVGPRSHFAFTAG